MNIKIDNFYLCSFASPDLEKSKKRFLSQAKNIGVYKKVKVFGRQMVNLEACRGDMLAKSPFFRKKVHFYKKFCRDSTLRNDLAGKILRPNRARKPDFGVPWDA